MNYVCDSIMGSGKTMAVYRYINEHPENRYIYITPYLSEVDRIRRACPEADFILPHGVPGNDKHSRVAQIRGLLRDRKNVACTQASFKLFGNDAVGDIAGGGYILILDEIVSAVSLAPVYEFDMQVLAEAGYARYDEDRREYTYTGKPYGEGVLTESVNYLRSSGLFGIDGGVGRNAASPLFYWDMLPEVFNSFKDVFILTYDFSINEYRYYLETHDMAYDRIYVGQDGEGYYLTKEKEREHRPLYLSRLGDLITFYSNSNYMKEKAGSEVEDFSKAWYADADERPLEFVQKYIRSFFRGDQAPSKNCMWTVYPEYEHVISPNGYASCYLPPDTRATGLFAGKDHLAYCVNVYPSPLELRYIRFLGYQVDVDKYALTTMLRWIWRSQIRDGKPITIYIPSARMKGLFVNWIGEVQGAPYLRDDCAAEIRSKRKKMEKLKMSRSIERRQGDGWLNR